MIRSSNSSCSTLLRDTYGSQTIDKLLNNGDVTKLPAVMAQYADSDIPQHLSPQFKTLNELVLKIPQNQRFSNGTDILKYAPSVLHELKDSVHSYTQVLQGLMINDESALNTSQFPKEFEQGSSTNNGLCMVLSIICFLQLHCVCGVDDDVSPSSAGLEHFHRLLEYEADEVRSLRVVEVMLEIFNLGRGRQDSTALLDCYERRQCWSARSDGVICVFRAGIEDPLRSCESIARVRVVNGSIWYGGRRYHGIHDLKFEPDEEHNYA